MPVAGSGGAMPMDGSSAADAAGDSHADAARDGNHDAVAETTAAADGEAGHEASADAPAPESGPVLEASAPDVRGEAAAESAAPEAGAPETAGPEAGARDAAVLDVSAQDVVVVVEAGPPDTGSVVEAGRPDTGTVVDAGPDTSIVEAGPPDVSVTDVTTTPDASEDDAAAAVEEPDVCPPATCGTANCDTVTNGCGNTIACGTCTSPDVCGGGGVPNMCGRVGGDPCDPITGNTIACLTSKDRAAGSCYQCAADIGCFDPTFNGKTCEGLNTTANASCQTVLGTAGVPSETSVCLATLGQIFSSHCAAGMQVNPCLCGSTAPDTCQNGTVAPTGAVYPIYQCDLGPAIGMITNNILSPALGAGVANTIIQCAQAFACDCAY